MTRYRVFTIFMALGGCAVDAIDTDAVPLRRDPNSPNGCIDINGDPQPCEDTGGGGSPGGGLPASSGADLIAAAPSGSQTTCQGVRDVASNGFRVTLANVGSQSAPPTTMIATAGDGGNPTAVMGPAYIAFPALAPGQVATLQLNVAFNVIGEYTLFFHADGTNVVTEINEANNHSYYCSYLL